MSAERIKRLREHFHRLHEDGCFVLPNPWNVGSAKLLAGMGFKALASTSSGFAWSNGSADGMMPRARVLEYLRALVTAVELPINADYETGFAASNAELVESVTMVMDSGVAGFSIEDASGDPNSPLLSIEDAATRISVARSTIDQAQCKVLLVARAENFLLGQPDIDDVLARLKAYAEAGADCLYAPGLRTREQIRTVVRAVAPKPVNVLIGWDSELTVQDLAALGVRRISVGGALARVAMGAFSRAAQGLADSGRFDFMAGTPSGAEMNAKFKLD